MTENKNIKVQFSKFTKEHKENYKLCGELITALTRTPATTADLREFTSPYALRVVQQAWGNGEYQYAADYMEAFKKNVLHSKTSASLIKKAERFYNQAVKKNDYKIADQLNEISLDGSLWKPHLDPKYAQKAIKVISMAVDNKDYDFAEARFSKVAYHANLSRFTQVEPHIKKSESASICEDLNHIVDTALLDKEYNLIAGPLRILYSANDPAQKKNASIKHGKMIDVALEKEDYNFVKDNAFKLYCIHDDNNKLTQSVDQTDQAIKIAMIKEDQKAVIEILKEQKEAFKYSSEPWEEKIKAIDATLQSFVDEEENTNNYKYSPERLQEVMDGFIQNYSVPKTGNDATKLKHS